MEYLTLNNGTRMPLVGFGTFSSISAPTHHTPCSEKAEAGGEKQSRVGDILFLR